MINAKVSLLATVTCALLSVSQLHAQTILFEDEPNGTPDNYQPVKGAFTAAATLTGDDQDGFLWQVSDVDAQRRWNLRLDGIPGALTVVDAFRLGNADDTNDVAPTKLFTMGSRDGSIPGSVEGVIFEPGKYLLGAAFAGDNSRFRPPMDAAGFDAALGEAAAEQPRQTGNYRLIVSERSALYLAGEPNNSTRKTAHELRFRNEYATYSTRAESWYRLDVGERETSEYWDVRMQVPVGTRLRARLLDAAGDVLTQATSDGYGRLAFRDLQLAAGEYFVSLVRPDGDASVLAIELASVGEATGNREGEPNDAHDAANRIDFSAPLAGRLGKKRDEDYFRFEHAPNTDEMQQLSVTAPGGGTVELCLFDSNAIELQCRTGKDGAMLERLVLAPGDYGIRIAGRQAGADYTLMLTDAGAPQGGTEVEPNDTIGRASALTPPRPVTATLSGEDVDFYRLVVEGQPQLWRVQAMGAGLREIRYHDGAGIQNQRKRGRGASRRLRLDNLYLLPGEHYFSVQGEDGDYRLIARSFGAPDPTLEREPNDDTQRMQPLEIGSKRVGLLADTEDVDYYRFYLANWQRLRVSVTPPPGGEIAAKLFWDDFEIGSSNGGGSTTQIEREGLFPPGEYQVSLSASTPSDGEYELSLTPLARFSCAVDCEPNDHPGLASKLPRDLLLTGQSGEWRDYDYYELPVFTRDTPFTILTGDSVNLDLIDADGESARLDRQPDGNWRGMLAAGQTRFLRIKSRGSYRLQFDFGQVPAPVASGVPEFGVVLDSTIRSVASFQTFGQRFDATLRVDNPTPTEQRVVLATAVSDAGWRIAPAASELVLPARGSSSVALTVYVPADAPSGDPVRLFAGVSQGGAEWREAALSIDVSDDAESATPVRGGAIPAALRGQWNLAASQLGAERLTLPMETPGDPGRIEDVGIGFDKLFDGVAVRGAGLLLDGRRSSRVVDIAVRLAGAPAKIAGFALDATGRTRLAQLPKFVELAVSDDGDTWQTVATEHLQPVRAEQYVVLETPVQASYARLRLADNFAGDGRVGLGEWKVIGTPLGTLPERLANLADPELGGHVVRSSPAIGPAWDREILSAAADVSSLRLDKGEQLEFVIGFHHDRAAQIAALQWIEARDASPGQRLADVQVSYSTESPLGPWLPIGQWQPTKAPTLTLEAPVWARFVRIVGRAAGADGTVWPPETLRIIERPHGSGYASILTEWGGASAAAAFELQNSAPAAGDELVPGNDRRTIAHALTPGRTVVDAAQLGAAEAWFKVRVGSQANRLSWTLKSRPSLRVVASLEDAVGRPLAIDTLEHSPVEVVQEATVQPGREYWLRIVEPQRNVVFVWDTSGSVAAQLPVIYSALGRYASGVTPGRDGANLLPFGAQPLLRDWYGESYLLQTVLNEYPRTESSSAAERTLATAAQALEPRDGARAVVLLTDAATSRYPQMWSWMQDVRPRVFAIRVGDESGSNFAASEEDLMQDWSRVNGGHSAYGASAREVDLAWRRAVSLLRRPAPFALSVDTRFEENPGPGYLKVMANRDGSGSETAALLILDASGSMLQRLDGRRRIDIAREVLTNAVTKIIPSGMPVALRVFGHKEPGTCRTDLVMPLQPLNAAKASATLEGINAMNLARTPIADSLKKVDDDLSDVDGRKVVLLITDGEETCDGDPAAVVEKLRQQGVDFTLNIVGFAIDETETEQMFRRWAEAGDGRYYAATNSEELARAVGNGLMPGFAVFDSTGVPRAQGTIGEEATQLPSGSYRVVVDTSPATVFENVRITGDTTTVLELE